ncbi:LysE family translocator [Halioxenophilus sp. WMMB6]|uniref:LysE family translocator n=1 Tax=Halioxenophilus sp. WMMB6 TaxID=3073815 RepID=UPI00295EDB0B|nr:LysE family translocator [Halioxenophilus sp. WMMB6]
MLDTSLELQYTSLTLGYFLSLLLFVFSVSITPGPNNLMVTASGMNFGYQRTLPHILGICAGCLILMSLTALGLGSLFVRFPVVHTALKVIGSLYLLWLAYKIFTASAPGAGKERTRPMSFTQAVLFQFVNPKAWTMGVTGISAFSLNGELLVPSIITVISVQTLLCLPCCSAWAIMGAKIRSWLASPHKIVWFNRTLGLVTASSVLMIVN